MGGRERSRSLSPICVGEDECIGGRSVPSPSDNSVRVDAPSGGGELSLCDVAGRDRPLCDEPQFSPAELLRPVAGPSGVGPGRFPVPLGPSPGLRLSPVRVDPEGVTEAQGVEGVRDDSDSPSLATARLVSRSSGPVSGTASNSSREGGPSTSTSFPPVSRESPRATASCVETIRRFARHAGFSSDVARQLTFARRSSTNSVYQAKWNVYRRWCRAKGHSVSRPSISKFADFLFHLHESKRLTIPCIRGYRAMLVAVFKWIFPEVVTTPVLRDLFRSFFNKNPVPRRIPPRWDLNKALDALRGPPYEPLADASFRNLTKKCLFLVALATVRRVGELQAISSRVAWLGPDASVSYVASFVAKTESASNPIPRSFVIKSLGEFVGDLAEERLLCPVRALKYYLEATRDLRPRSPHLFVSPRVRTRPISKNAVSFFIREVITGAGAVGADEGPAPRAHSVRGMGTSCVFLKNWRVADVLSAATWKSSYVFASFYLRDLAYVLDDTRSLGPFVAAGGIIGSGGGHSSQT